MWPPADLPARGKGLRPGAHSLGAAARAAFVANADAAPAIAPAGVAARRALHQASQEKRARRRDYHMVRNTRDAGEQLAATFGPRRRSRVREIQYSRARPSKAKSADRADWCA